MKAITTGTHKIDNPANTAPIGPPPWFASNLTKPNGAVIRPGDVRNKFGQKKSFHMYWPVIIITAEIAGHESGTMTCRIIRRWPAPSTLAESSRSRGIVRKCCRNKKIPSTWIRAGTMRLAWLLRRCIYRISINSGIATTWVGRVRPARNRVNSTSRPRNSNPRKRVGRQDTNRGGPDDNRDPDDHRVDEVEQERSRREQGTCSWPERDVTREPDRR